MSVISYMKKFYFTIDKLVEKKMVIADLDAVFKELNDITLPMVEEVLYLDVFDTKWYKALERVTAKADVSKGKNVTERHIEIITALLDNQPKIMSQVETNMKNVVVATTSDLADINWMMYVNILRDYSRLTRIYASAVIAESQLKLNHKVQGNGLKALDEVKDEDNIRRIETATRIAALDSQNLMKSFSSLKGIQLSETFDEAGAGLRRGASDPMSIGLIPMAINPIYYLGLAWNTHIKKKYELAKAELEYSRLALLELEQLDSNSANAKQIEKNKEYWRKRILELEDDIKSIEEDVER